MSIETTWAKTKEIKELFRPLERVRWGSREYAMELMVQVGHLGDILLRQGYKINPKTPEENRRIIGDEVADVILNTFSIAEELQIDIPQILKRPGSASFLWEDIIEDSLIQFPGQVDPFTIYGDIAWSGAQILNSLANPLIQPSAIIPNLTRITFGSTRIAGLYGINIDHSFSTLHDESIVFVQRNQP